MPGDGSGTVRWSVGADGCKQGSLGKAPRGRAGLRSGRGGGGTEGMFRVFGGPLLTGVPASHSL